MAWPIFMTFYIVSDKGCPSLTFFVFIGSRPERGLLERGQLVFILDIINSLVILNRTIYKSLRNFMEHWKLHKALQSFRINTKWYEINLFPLS